MSWHSSPYDFRWHFFSLHFFPLVLCLNCFKLCKPRRVSVQKAPRLKPRVVGRGLTSLGSGAMYTCRGFEPTDTAVYPICFCAGIVQACACLSTWRLTARSRADGPLINVGEFVFPSLCKPCETFYSCRVCFLFSPITHRDISILFFSLTQTHTLARLVWKQRARCRGAGDCGNEGVS